MCTYYGPCVVKHPVYKTTYSLSNKASIGVSITIFINKERRVKLKYRFCVYPIKNTHTKFRF